METNDSGGSPEGAPRKSGRRSLIYVAVIMLFGVVFGVAIGYGFSRSGPLSGLSGLASIVTFASGSTASASGEIQTTKASASAGKSDKPAEGAWIKVTPKEWDFGQVKSTEVVTHSFQLKNAGSGVLTISTVSASCGCTKGKVAKKELAPGEVTELLVTYDPSHHSNVTPGATRRLIYIDSNDPSAPEIVIPITAFVVKVAKTRSPTSSATVVSPQGK